MDIPTPLYREGGLLFLPDAYLLLATDKIEGEEKIRDIQILFNNHSDLSHLECGRSTDICVP